MRINIFNSIVQLPNIEKNMSTTSSATASGRDCVPSDKPKLKSRMCLFVIAWKDDTPFDNTSVTEEDIIKMCIKLGHAHPLGVFHYSTMELITLFHSTEEMQCTTWGLLRQWSCEKRPLLLGLWPFRNPCEGIYYSSGRGLFKTPISTLIRGGRTPLIP